MKIEEKQQVIEALANRLAGARAVYLTDFTGLDVQSLTDLRARLRKAGVEYMVVKNTLALRAVGGMELPDIAEFFNGPTGLVIGREDAVAAARVLEEFAREHDDRPAVKVGIVERRKVTAEQVGRIAKLPPREQLLAQLAGVMQAPLAELAFVLQAKLQEAVGLLEALREQKQS